MNNGRLIWGMSPILSPNKKNDENPQLNQWVLECFESLLPHHLYLIEIVIKTLINKALKQNMHFADLSIFVIKLIMICPKFAPKFLSWHLGFQNFDFLLILLLLIKFLKGNQSCHNKLNVITG